MLAACGAGDVLRFEDGFLTRESDGECLDAIHGFPDTDVGAYACHAAGDPDAANQQWVYDPADAVITNKKTGQCVAATPEAPERACVGLAVKGCDVTIDGGVASIACDPTLAPNATTHIDVVLALGLGDGVAVLVELPVVVYTMPGPLSDDREESGAAARGRPCLKLVG